MLIRTTEEREKVISERERMVIIMLQDIWKSQTYMFVESEVEQAIKLKKIPHHWLEIWVEDYKYFCEELNKVDLEIISSAVNNINKIVVNLSKKQTKDIQVTNNPKVREWVQKNSTELIKNLTEQQKESIKVLFDKYIFEEPLAPVDLAKLLKRIIGLTEREAMAVLKFYESLRDSGLSHRRVYEQVGKYHEFLLSRRAERIARTELARAYCYGQNIGIEDIILSGLVEREEMRKVWMTAPVNPCIECAGLDGEKVSFYSNFSNGASLPPAHPNCRCDVGYEI